MRVQTYSASLDVSILDNDKNQDFGGIGLLATNDVTTVNVQNSSGMLSFAYSKSLSSKFQNYLSLGIQAGVMQKKIGSQLSTDNQWVDLQGFDANLATGENFNNISLAYASINAGIFWFGYFKNKAYTYAGVSAFNLTTPKQSFMGLNSISLKRYVFHAGGKIPIAKRTNVGPDIIIMNQNSVSEINFGARLEYSLIKNSTSGDKVLSIGGWYRNKDAIIVVTTLEYTDFKLGFSYDINTSGLKTVTNNVGAFEISLIYHFRKPLVKSNTVISNPCPRY